MKTTWRLAPYRILTHKFHYVGAVSHLHEFKAFYKDFFVFKSVPIQRGMEEEENWGGEENACWDLLDQHNATSGENS